VSSATPAVTVIIPCRPGQAEIAAAAAARALDYPKDKLEILIARGRQPAVQRNVALRAARGELIYFLDDDALPNPENLLRSLEHFREANVSIVGGPNLCPSDAPLLERVFAVVLSSWLAFGPSRARYDPVGSARSSNEKELILCNLLARRQPLVDAGGFNEALYPNEENALMDELQKRGTRLVYDPQLVVHRRPRPTLGAFFKMLFTYGRGRAEQFRLHPTPGSLLNFVPPLFCLYLAAAPVLAMLRGPVVFAPLILYFLAVVSQTLVSACRKGAVTSLLAMPLLIASHIFYGIGFWRGLTTHLKTGRHSTGTEVQLESIRL
jgi:glycosyltransferase involved in cell wall biosynthesis